MFAYRFIKFGGKFTLFMGKFEKIIVINNLIESQIMDDILNEREISHLIKPHTDSVYPGLFHVQSGWGHIEAPAECKDEIIEIYNEIIGNISNH